MLSGFPACPRFSLDDIMALRNQPYIPLYVQDFLTDEKLIECSAEATGVYIRLMCIMHKSAEYGTILLKQKYEMPSKQVEGFACKLAKHMPYTVTVIHKGLHELIDEGVLVIEGSKLLQRRMIHDNDISNKRSKAGHKGGITTQFASSFAQAKVQANSEDEYEDEYIKKKEINKGSISKEEKEPIYKEIVDDLNSILDTSYRCNSQKTRSMIKARLNEGFTLEQFKIVHRKKAAEWGSDEKMVKFLRPETLYGNKFESYLNQKDKFTPRKARPKIEKLEQPTEESRKKTQKTMENIRNSKEYKDLMNKN